MRALTPYLLLLTLLISFGCAGNRPIPYLTSNETVRSEDLHLGVHRFEQVSCSRKASESFQRGLALAYGFNYFASEREFRNAAEHDPNCAMAWWGVALVLGPHINFPLVPPEKAKIAFEAVSKAKQLSKNASPLEQRLIGALGHRYSENPQADRAPLDQAYAVAMKSVYEAFPNNSDVGALYAEALMDLHPWDLWANEGEPKEWTPEIVALLEQVLQTNPNNPHANHLYIHAIEASPNPAKARAAADRLMTLVPGSGHLLHMPAHIYARLGEWDLAADSNLRAIRTDNAFARANPRPEFYAMYMAHSRHFLAFGRMMQGRSADALAAAREMVAAIPDQFIKDYGPIADGFLVMVPEVLMRFGRWEEILKEPAPRAALPFSTAMWHFTRAVSLNALGREKEAHSERAHFINAVKRIPADSMFGNNLSSDLTAIAALVLDGEIAAKRKEYRKAIVLLRKAVTLEDALRYDEPPDWIQPVRHTLGGVLIRAKLYTEAEKTYREDLNKFPNNGWSLYGLSEALRLQGRAGEAELARQQFEKSWANADVSIKASCLCQIE